MVDAVRFFAESIEYEAKTLEELFADIENEAGRKNYCTQIHSMKNSASTIGIIPLAGLAKILEDAARSGELNVLKVMTCVFLEYWYSYQEKLAVFLPSAVKEKKRAEDCKTEIQKLFQLINEAAEEMDIDALDLIWTQLAEYQFDKDKQDLLDKVHKAIMGFDVDYLQKISCEW